MRRRNGRGAKEPMRRVYLKTEKLENYERLRLSKRTSHEQPRALSHIEERDCWPIKGGLMLPKQTLEIDDFHQEERLGETCWIKFKGISKEFSMRGNIRRAMRGSFGYVAETKEEVLVVLRNRKEIRIPGPITRSRIVSGLRGRRNLLVVVLNDRIEITDFYKELYV